MRTKIVVNAAAGRGHAARLVDRARDYLARYGVEADFAHTQAPGDGVRLALEAAQAGYERVVAMGGDGTATEVANGLVQAGEAGHEAVLGLIPAGSGNDYAYGVGIPTNLEKSCRRLADGNVRSVDMIQVVADGQTHLFNNTVGIGFDADVLLETHKMGQLRGFLLYLGAVFRVLASDGKWPYPANITLDGQLLPYRAVTLVSVCNGPRVGGGFYLTPNALPDDGLFDVIVADKLGRLHLASFILRVMRGTHVNARPVTILRARHLLVEGGRGLPGHMDGEVLCTQGRRIEFQILPGRLKVWC
jgi:diacylglycerol kinase (ATP)